MNEFFHVLRCFNTGRLLSASGNAFRVRNVFALKVFPKYFPQVALLEFAFLMSDSLLLLRKPVKSRYSLNKPKIDITSITT